jgi:hypothetical protein
VGDEPNDILNIETKHIAERIMLRTEDDTIESYLKKIEAQVREDHPVWDKQRQWKIGISSKIPMLKKEAIDYDEKIIRIDKGILRRALNGDESTEIRILAHCSACATGLKITYR